MFRNDPQRYEPERSVANEVQSDSYRMKDDADKKKYFNKKANFFRTIFAGCLILMNATNSVLQKLSYD